MPLTDWFSIFRTGTHTSSTGQTNTYTTDDLDKIIARYENQTPSPCVITHEELYSPFAYAQVAALRRTGDVLEARCDPETIEPQFKKLVEDGRLYARSLQLLREDEDGWRLGHVAFLGAKPPAVDGLAPIQMAASGLTFEADDAWEKVYDKRSISRIWRALRELAEKVLEPDRVNSLVSDWDVERAQEEVGRAEERATQQGERQMAASTENADDLAAERTRLNEESEALATRQREFAATQARGRVDALIDSGRLTPAMAEGLAEFAAALSDQADSLKFSRGEGSGAETVKTSPREFLFGFLDKLPQGRTPLGGAIAGGPAVRGDLTNAHEIRKAALEYQADERSKGRFVNNMEAVAHVTAGRAS